MKIIPVPKKITVDDGRLDLENITVAVEAGRDIRLTKAAVVLKGEIEDVCGKFAKTYAAKGEPTEKSVWITVCDGGNEGYELTVSEKGVRIVGNSAAGAFYGIQSFRQMLKEYGAAVPFCRIEDEPDFSERGFYHDITRGRVPTLKKMKEIAEQLSYFKINSLQIYVEDAFDLFEFDGIIKKTECMTAAEMMELDDYCYDHFIELVPSLSTFGHLYRLLQSDKYRHLCEYENWEPYQIFWVEKMAHHTIDVSNPESIEVVKSMIDQYVPLFRSNKFNICCDETFDLCKGRNKGKDEGDEYFGFVTQIIEHVRSYGKQVQMWGDVVLAHMEKAKKYLAGVTMLNWNYTKEAKEENVKAIAETGLEQIVCPGTSSWNRFIEELDRSVGNISGLAAYGKKYGATGILNTNWGDFGNICSWNCEMYGMVFGAEKGWNPAGEVGEDFEMAASLLLYGCKDANVVKLIYDMGMCERTCDWMGFVYWYSANTKEGRKTELAVDRPKAKENIARIGEIKTELQGLLCDGDVKDDLLLAARAIKLMNKTVLMIVGEEGYGDRTALKAEWAEWFCEYREAWMRDDKESQVDAVGEFLDSLTTLF